MSSCERFNELYELYYQTCLLFAKSYVHDDMIAEDIASESLLKLWQLGKVETINNPKAVLFVITKNKALDYLKHKKAKAAAIESMAVYAKMDLDIRISSLEASSLSMVFEKDIQRIIEETVQKQPELTRDIFVKNRFGNIPRPELAQLYNISVKGIDYHIYKVVDLLKKALKDYL